MHDVASYQGVVHSRHQSANRLGSSAPETPTSDSPFSLLLNEAAEARPLPANENCEPSAPLTGPLNRGDYVNELPLALRAPAEADTPGLNAPDVTEATAVASVESVEEEKAPTDEAAELAASVAPIAEPIVVLEPVPAQPAVVAVLVPPASIQSESAPSAPIEDSMAVAAALLESAPSPEQPALIEKQPSPVAPPSQMTTDNTPTPPTPLGPEATSQPPDVPEHAERTSLTSGTDDEGEKQDSDASHRVGFNTPPGNAASQKKGMNSLRPNASGAETGQPPKTALSASGSAGTNETPRETSLEPPPRGATEPAPVGRETGRFARQPLEASLAASETHPRDIAYVSRAFDGTQALNLQQPPDRLTAAAAPAAPPMVHGELAATAAVSVAGLAIEIAARAQAGLNRFEIRLDPPELGRIDVRLDIDHSGEVTSRLVIERAETLDVLRRDAGGLERALQQAGLKTADNGLQFTLRDQAFAGRDGRTPTMAGARIMVPDPDFAPIETIRTGYVRLFCPGGGIDIRV